MNMAGINGQAVKVRPGKASKREVSIWQLLVWAFQVEKVSVEFDDLERLAGERPGVGMEYILMQRYNLGCSVDGGGRSEAHPDADRVATALAALPEGVGGRRMATWMAELARADIWPEMPKVAVPRCEPLAVRRCKHGVYAERTYWHGDGRVGRWPAPHLGKNDGFVCLVRYSGTMSELGAKRRAWQEWWAALLELRITFQVSGLTAFEVTDVMPPMAPWRNPS